MSSEKDQALVKEKAFVKYERLLKQAEQEGRTSGRFRCIVCGMRYHEKPNAEDCCRVVLEAGGV
jgi:rubrerythrin